MSHQTTPRTAVLEPAPALSDAALHWSERLAVPLLEPAAAGDYDLWLELQADAATPGYRLSLQANAAPAPGPVMVDFVGGALGHRRRFGGGRGQPLARAVGLKHGATPQVLDLTAGLGRDAFVLASLGCTVRMVERVALVAALLENALTRAADDPEVSAIVARMELIGADALQWLSTMPAADQPDVIYLDPMYPQRRKQALVKKEMQLFHRLVGADTDAPALLAEALRRARKRVVVKRPRSAPPLEGPAPQFAIKSPNTRYDVYPRP